MNRYADIHEGFEVFALERERAAAETTLQQQPALCCFPYLGKPWKASRIEEIHLLGQFVSHKPFSHPFDYEEGYLKARGASDKNRECTLVARWSDYGKILDILEQP